MDVTRAIVHSIQKEQYSREVAMQLRADVLPVTQQLTELLQQILSLYNSKSGRGYGEFEPERFLTRELAELEDDPVAFVAFTGRCMGELSSRLAAANFATGGYVLFLEYDQGADSHFMIVMLKSTPGLTFNDTLDILEASHLDLNKLHFAARVNLSKWKAEGDRYISFLKGRASEVASYFKDFIGVTEYTEASENTRQLVNAVKDYCAELPEAESDALQRRVHEYCQDKAKTGQPLLIEDLSHFINEEDPAAFLQYANEREITDAIELDRRGLRSLVRYYGRDSEVSVSFSASAYRRRVRYDEETNSLTISPLPDALVNQLRRAAE